MTNIEINKYLLIYFAKQKKKQKRFDEITAFFFLFVRV